MVDALTEIIDLLTPWPGVAVWRGQLPKGFTNANPAVVVTVNGDDHSVSSATRRVVFQFRVYGGSEKATDAASTYNALADRLSAVSGGRILSVGELSGQELPADPVTGWPGYMLRAVARLSEE